MIKQEEDQCNHLLGVYIFTYRLVGCQDLLEDIPWQSEMMRRGSIQVTSPGDSKGFMRSSKSFHGRGSSKTYNIKEDNTSSE